VGDSIFRGQANATGAQAQPRAASTAHQTARETEANTKAAPWRSYRVKRGDTLWDIAERKLDAPTLWPAIANASDDIRQPDGRQLEDPDLIVTGWTLRIPTNDDDKAGSANQERSGDGPNHVEPEAPTAESAAELPETPLRPHSDATGSSSARGTSAITPENDTLPLTPLRPEGPGTSSSNRSATGAIAQSAEHVGATPLNPSADSPSTLDAADDALLVLPEWVRHPLTPASFADAPQATRTQVLAVLAQRRDWSGSPDE